MNNINFLNNYEIEFNNCYEEINKIINFTSDKIYLRKESHFEASELHYIIELISPLRENNDDYGICVNFLNSIVNNNICLDIDVSKSFGPVYFSKSFKIKAVKNEIDIVALDESLDWLKSLPDLVVEIYLRDYSY